MREARWRATGLQRFDSSRGELFFAVGGFHSLAIQTVPEPSTVLQLITGVALPPHSSDAGA